ncbi:hypothetical protein NAMH_1030 [Nautilia profundicola AmH]|uniref:Uncharacterized protein n=1 Tax=Nautilia profundicola (strain ATCC BAA-1463 / DSM 18972 / AmH) TaxID=598659 RepID=B9L9X1_NAUPA|nr:hypothetical protein NAMH_1030 [Nautilia profundicola AmH]
MFTFINSKLYDLTFMHKLPVIRRKKKFKNYLYLNVYKERKAL